MLLTAFAGLTSGTLREANPVRFFGAAVLLAVSELAAIGFAATGFAAAGFAARLLSVGSLGELFSAGVVSLLLVFSLLVVEVRRERFKFEPCRVRRAAGLDSSESVAAASLAGFGLDCSADSAACGLTGAGFSFDEGGVDAVLSALTSLDLA